MFSKKIKTMVAIPLLILALAAGVYLLVKVKRDFMGGVFEALAWLVIVLSLVAIGFTATRSFTHGCKEHCGKAQKCHVEKDIVVKQYGPGQGCPAHESGEANAMGCCKMAGDSIVMDQATCEKMMGKEACETMRKERGQCILSKAECQKACKASGQSCCAGGGEAKAACCAGDGAKAGCNAHGEAPTCHKPQQ